MDDDINDIMASVISEGNSPSPAPAPEPSPSPSPAPHIPVDGDDAPPTPAPAPTPAAAPTPAPAPAAGTPPAEGTPASDVKQNIGTVVNQKAPGTWSPQAREHWNTVPAEVREEVWKREKEVSRALTTSATARAFQNEFNQAMQPFMSFIQAEGVQPLQAATYMMQNAAILRVGSVQQKAELVANIIGQWGIDLQLLDRMLEAQMKGQRYQPGPNDNQAPPPNQIQAMINQAIQPLVQQQQQSQRALLQQVEAEVDAELNQFAAEHEFYEDVKDDMADILEVASRRGVKMTLTEAYERATLLSVPVRAVLDQRKAQASATEAHKIAQQAKSGAFGVQNSAATGTTSMPAGEEIDDAIRWAVAHHSGRG